MIKTVAFIVFALFFLSACEYFRKDAEEPQGEPIARVYDKYLYPEDLKALNIKGVAPEDSAKMVNEYVENWVKHNLMVAYANENLPPSKLNIEKQIQDYRESLIIYTYEKEFIAQNLDTLIDENDVAEFYRNNPQSFQLSHDIYRLHYMKLVHDSPKIDSAKYWMKNYKPRFEDDLRSYAFQYALDFNFNDSIWLDSRMLNNVIPMQRLEGQSVPSSGFFQMVDSPYVYLGQIKDFKIKETTAPLSYVSDDIRKMILNKRKMQLLKEFNRNIYKDAAQKDYFEIYN